MLLQYGRYLKAAMSHAIIERTANGHSYEGRIAELESLCAVGSTRDACRFQLRNALEAWLALRLCRQLPVPAIQGIPLTGWIGIQRGA